MKEMRKKVIEFEEREGTKVKCPLCGFRCRYCPVAYFSCCKKLGRFLEAGRWK